MEQGPDFKKAEDITDLSFLAREILRNISAQGTAANLHNVFEEITESTNYRQEDVRTAYAVLENRGMVNLLPSPEKELYTPEDAWITTTEIGEEFQASTDLLDTE